MHAVTEEDVRTALADLVEPERINGWIHGQFSGVLGDQSPVDLIAAGEGQRVLDLIEAIKSGAFL